MNKKGIIGGEDSHIPYFIVGMILGLSLGTVLLGFFISNFGTTPVQDEFLDQTCAKIFGEGYVYNDDENFGTDVEIDCYNSTAIKNEYEFIKVAGR